MGIPFPNVINHNVCKDEQYGCCRHWSLFTGCKGRVWNLTVSRGRAHITDIVQCCFTPRTRFLVSRVIKDLSLVIPSSGSIPPPTSWSEPEPSTGEKRPSSSLAKESKTPKRRRGMYKSWTVDQKIEVVHFAEIHGVCASPQHFKWLQQPSQDGWKSTSVSYSVAREEGKLEREGKSHTRESWFRDPPVGACFSQSTAACKHRYAVHLRCEAGEKQLPELQFNTSHAWAVLWVFSKNKWAILVPHCRCSDIGIIISNVGVRMLGKQWLIIFPGKGGCSNNWMVWIIRLITVSVTSQQLLSMASI